VSVGSQAIDGPRASQFGHTLFLIIGL